MPVLRYLVFAGALVCCAIFSMVLAPTASAVSSGSKLFVSGDNTFFVYAKSGEKISANFTRSSQVEPAVIFPEDVQVTLEGPGLAAQRCTLPKDIAIGAGCGFAAVTAPETGIYRLMFKLPDTARLYTQVSPIVRWGANLFSWTLTVAEDGVEKQGRIWSELYAIRQPLPAEFATDLVYHYISEGGYLYKATYRGYNGQISTLSADAFGIRNGSECQSSYQSIDVNDTKRSPSFGNCGAGYKLFFETPSGDLPQMAKRWDDTMDWVSPSISRPIVKDLAFTHDDKADTQSGLIRFALDNFVGQYTVKIDTDEDGNYDGSSDVKIHRVIKKQNSGVQEIKFNGVNGDGQAIPASRPIGIKIQIEKVAEIHLVKADVEGMTGGLELTRLSGDNAPTTRICWDDTNLSPIADTALATLKPDGRACPDSVGGVHGWEYGTNSWGDMRYIDDWAYATAKVDGVAEIRYPDNMASVQAQQTRNSTGLMIGLIAVVAMGVAAVVVVGIVVIRRKRRARQLKQAELHQQPTDYPGPGEPRPPLQ